jgi:hypothetical protein
MYPLNLTSFNIVKELIIWRNTLEEKLTKKEEEGARLVIAVVNYVSCR